MDQTSDGKHAVSGRVHFLHLEEMPAGEDSCPRETVGGCRCRGSLPPPGEAGLCIAAAPLRIEMPDRDEFRL